MDLAKRQEILKAVSTAADSGAHVMIRRNDGTLFQLRCDLTCFETHVQATADDGSEITIAYSDIDEIGISGEKTSLNRDAVVGSEPAPLTDDPRLEDSVSENRKPVAGRAKQIIAEIIGDGALAEEGKREAKGKGLN